MIDSLGPLGSCSSKVGIAPSLDDKTAIMDGLESIVENCETGSSSGDIGFVLTTPFRTGCWGARGEKMSRLKSTELTSSSASAMRSFHEGEAVGPVAETDPTFSTGVGKGAEISPISDAGSRMIALSVRR
jgi:hypothetical protein